jgi:pyruvate/2-oxoacid:ferredoxin oxidoreductase alpha subunit
MHLNMKSSMPIVLTTVKNPGQRHASLISKAHSQLKFSLATDCSRPVLNSDVVHLQQTFILMQYVSLSQQQLPDALSFTPQSLLKRLKVIQDHNKAKKCEKFLPSGFWTTV